MSFEIILLILLAALLHASWNAVIKGGSNKLYETGLNCFGGGVGVLFIVPSSPFRRWKASSSWPAPAPSISLTTSASP